jgi:N-ethylmaleimide reductase
MITSVHSFNGAFTDVSEVPCSNSSSQTFQTVYKGTLIINKGFNKETGIKVLKMEMLIW